MRGKTIERAAPVIAFAYCAAMSAIILFDYVLAWKFGNDFGVYWRTANQPVELAYRSAEWFPFPYAPTMLLWISPLGFVPKWLAYFLFVGLSIAAFVATCRPYLSKATISLCLISPPIIRAAFTGQVSIVLAAMTIWACGTGNRLAAGITFGAIASIKPQLVVMAPLMFILNRDWRAVMASAAAFAAIVLLSFAFGFERWPEWLASIDHFHGKVVGTRIIEVGVTPALVAERLGLLPLPFIILGIIVGAATVSLCRNAPPLEKAAAITLGSLMASPYALAYDLAAAVPFVALCAMNGRILAALGLGAAANPLPLIVSTYELVRAQALGHRPRQAGLVS